MPNLTDNAKQLLESRYFLKDENGNVVEDWWGLCNRLAQVVSKNKQEEYLNYLTVLYNLAFIPSSPQLMFLGTDYPMPSSCFVLGPIKDDLDSILNVLHDTCLAQKHSGGSGYNFSHLRPQGDRIATTGGEASGPVSFMHLYDQAMQVVIRAGKKQGAQMAVLNCDHPEIFKFIHCKDDDSELPTFNVSVGITDKFIESVRQDADWDLVFDGQVYQTVKARDIWDEITKRAWENGDPGVLFLDTANKNNNFDRPIEACNPCVVGDTLILTKEGYTSIEEVVGKEVEIWNGETFSKVAPFSTGMNEILKISFSNGAEIFCTTYHKFILINGDRIEAQHLTVGDKLEKFEMPLILDGEEYQIDAYSQGFYSGDGNSGLETSWIYSPKYACMEKLVGKFGKENEKQSRVTWYHGPMYDKDFVPIKGTARYCIEWLAGILDSDGTVVSYENSDALQISSTGKGFLDRIRLMLSRLSIRAKISKGRDSGYRDLPDGAGGKREYWCRANYRLLINCEDTQKLLELGLNTKRLKIREGKVQRDARRFIQITNIEKFGIEETFCFNEPLTHRGCFNGIITGQCGEITAPNMSSCNLGAINLSMMVQDGKILWDTLAEVTRIGVRFLDNVLDCAWWPIEEITKNALKDRNIGLGVMGLADMLIQLGFPYDSPEAVELGRIVMEFISIIAESESLSLGKGEKKNVTLTSIAPTGSRSFIANCSPGIEPIFGVVSVNNTKMGSFYNVHPLFEEMAKERSIYSEELISKIAERGSVQGIKEIPEDMQKLFKTAMEIDYTWHIKMQAAFQKSVDTSISKTVNLPHNATIEDVSAAFMLAYDSECKSVTVYRDGSREIQPMDNKTNKHKCPNCGATLAPKEGCWSCESCGYSLCSLI